MTASATRGPAFSRYRAQVNKSDKSSVTTSQTSLEKKKGVLEP